MNIHARPSTSGAAPESAKSSPCLQCAPATDADLDFAQLSGPLHLIRSKRIAMAKAALAADRLAQGQLSKQGKAAAVHEWAVSLLAVLKGAR